MIIRPEPPLTLSAQAEVNALLKDQRQEALARLQGKYEHLPGSSDDFAASKEEEKAREERHWLQSNFSCSPRIGG